VQARKILRGADGLTAASVAAARTGDLETSAAKRGSHNKREFPHLLLSRWAVMRRLGRVF
jgi:hypothetical protein